MAETLRKVTKEKRAGKGAGREWAVSKRSRIEVGDVSLSPKLQMPPKKEGTGHRTDPFNTSWPRGAGRAGW